MCRPTADLFLPQLALSCGQIDHRVSFQIAEAQTKLAHSSKREAVSQKAIAILGTVFLPGAYLSVRAVMPFIADLL